MQPEEWPRARTVLTSAVKLERDDRSRVISEAFPDDPDLWQELLSILDTFDKVAPPDRPVPTGGTRVSAQSTDVPSDPLLAAGAAYGPYRVLKQLGAGGMGQVFLAEDLSLGRRVALKSLAGRWLESPTARQRLMREARAAAALTHHHIATLYHVQEDAGHLLLVMEYVEGRPVSALLENGPIALGHALRLALDIAEAVSFAHDHGIIHCDIKPANVQVTVDGRAKVLDFGLARARFDPDDWEDLTPGKLLGTPGYMAPERLARGTLNASGDIYSLGVVIFEMTTGRRPFDEGDLSALLLTVLGGCPPKPSSIVSEIPPALDAVVDRALARDPTLRYQSARELRRDLQAVLELVEDTTPITVSPATGSGADQVTLSWQQRVLFVIGAAGATIVALTLLGFVTSTIYNSPLGRTAGFEGESPLLWPVWGLRAILPPAVFMAWVAMGFLLLVAVCRLLFAMIGPIRRWCDPVLLRARQMFDWILAAPGSLVASTLLSVQVAALALLLWWSWPIMEALDTFITQDSAGELTALGLGNRAEHHLLWRAMSVQVLVFGLGWYHILKRERKRRDRDAIALSTAGITVAVLSVIAFQVVPYRILYHNEAERVSYQSQLCYLVGERADEARLFCPNQPPPWNRIVKLNDPALTRERIDEGIFDALEANH